MKENSIENLQNKEYFKNIDEAIKIYKEFGIYKDSGFIESIDPDFFFNLTDMFLSDYKRVLKENERLKEYIAIAPNLDEITAIKYRNIQQDAYIQGRAEEQKKAKQIIYENYISKQKIKDKIKELEKKHVYQGKYCTGAILVLQELIEEREEK